MPQRIQRQRYKGWSKGSAVIVTRPGEWGNPYAVPPKSPPEVIIAAVQRFAVYAEARLTVEPNWLAPLRGKDLACWCAEDAPACHADVLLQLANRT
jgi:Domain of unknown function (DUF4326)